MAQQNSVAIASAIAVQTIGGVPAVELQQTIFAIGEETLAAETAMARGKEALDVLDANLHDIVKGLPYTEFMLVRDFHKAGAIDKGRTDDAAQKIWERQINRMVSAFDFVKPKSESKDAVRKAEAKAAEIAKLAEFGDGELADLKADLLAKGDAKSLREAMKLNKEIDRRNATELDAAKAQRKAIADKLIARVKELSKAGTDDADALLISALQLLG
jgi:uncharacterized protein YbaA (DUF1428 family)